MNILVLGVLAAAAVSIPGDGDGELGHGWHADVEWVNLEDGKRAAATRYF
jgi:hypothetical protein